MRQPTNPHVVEDAEYEGQDNGDDEQSTQPKAPKESRVQPCADSIQIVVVRCNTSFNMEDFVAPTLTSTKQSSA